MESSLSLEECVLCELTLFLHCFSFSRRLFLRLGSIL